MILRILKLDGVVSPERKTGFGSELIIHQNNAVFLAPQQHQIEFRWVWTHNVITMILDVYHATIIVLNLDGH